MVAKQQKLERTALNFKMGSFMFHQIRPRNIPAVLLWPFAPRQPWQDLSLLDTKPAMVMLLQGNAFRLFQKGSPVSTCSVNNIPRNIFIKCAWKHNLLTVTALRSIFLFSLAEMLPLTFQFFPGQMWFWAFIATFLLFSWWFHREKTNLEVESKTGCWECRKLLQTGL